MNIQENTVYTKYQYLVPKGRKISKKQFNKLFQEYEKDPDHKKQLIRRLREMSIKKGKSYRVKKSNKRKRTKRRR